MTFTYSGDDSNGDVRETVTSELVTIGTYVMIVAEDSGSVGTVTTRWNGVSPCGEQSYCRHPPTQNPTKSPTPEPTRLPTPSPTFQPTTSPSTGPTRDPTPSPTDRPTTEPSTGPTREPTPSPTET
eukprot:UN25412